MQVLVDRLATLTAAPTMAFENLAVTPLLGPDGAEPDYLTLDEALALGLARVTEVSEAGSVPELRLANQADRAVLLLDGEELVGAKQNRVLNLTILAPAQATIAIPVSCVEAGRWSHQSPEFGSQGRAFYAAGRAAKATQVTESLRASGTRQSRQGEVWDDIAAKSARLGSHSPTAAMAGIYDDYQAPVAAYVQALPAVAGQVGAVFAINGQVRGIELFDFAATLRKLLAKLVASYALDAIDPHSKTPGVANSTAAAFLRATAGAACTRHASIGEGTDLRLTAAGLAGGTLIARDRVVHLCAFAVGGNQEQGAAGPTGRMARASTRAARGRGR